MMFDINKVIQESLQEKSDDTDTTKQKRKRFRKRDKQCDQTNDQAQLQQTDQTEASVKTGQEDISPELTAITAGLGALSLAKKFRREKKSRNKK